MVVRKLLLVFKEAAVGWNADNAPMLGAAVAYFAVFSLAPVLLITIAIANLVLEEQTVRDELGTEIRHTGGPLVADAFHALWDNASDSGDSAGITLLGVGTLLLGASGVFLQLQEALNVIWKTAALPRKGNIILHFIRNRLLSFCAVLVTGILLVSSLIANSVLTALSDKMAIDTWLGDFRHWHPVSVAVSFIFVSLLFAAVFKLLPDTKVRWRDVGWGALLTGALFTLGQHLISLYIGYAAVASTFGAAGSLVVLLIWVYYSVQIVLFGAEFAYAYARIMGSRTPPVSDAVSEGATLKDRQGSYTGS
jgi:membrane protein